MAPKGAYLSFKSIILEDIQPLFGGQDLIMHDDGVVLVYVITPKETVRSNKYRAIIPVAKLEEIDRVLAETEFEKIQTQDRRGVSDEAHPKITVLYRSGERVEKEKWANDEHPEFDKIYNWLTQLAKDIENEGTPDI